ncbi:tyrosine-type recombinase/integrase [Maricaulis salignorans]|uniref:Integrase n=1 Tax=Maricaulis salignorans TaxID=144026 RepID=A0A1G9U9P8_9PROT|nr:site-specific integrase [Maricaulis salignorans]SDM56444.1 Integrase [Maricaulis salignorans]
MKLTTTKLNALRAPENGSSLKRSDGRGLFIWVHPTNTKTWKYSCRSGGKQKTFTLGNYPEIGLADAREMVTKLRSAQQTGQDTNEALRVIKNGGLEAAPSLRSFVDEVIEHAQREGMAPATESKKWWLRDAIPTVLLDKAINRVTRAELAEFVGRLVSLGHLDKARRVARLLVKACDRAVIKGWLSDNIAERLSCLVPARAARHHPAIVDPYEVAGVLGKVYYYGGSSAARMCLRLEPYLLLRPGEVRAGRWSEIDWKNSEWVIPAERMKMSRDHIVPLSPFVVDLLRRHRSQNPEGELIFPSRRSADVYLSENTMNQALWRLGYKGRMTAHGFRSMASTLLNEMGWNSDWIEAQLSHSQRNAVRGAYNRAEYLEGRRTMMRCWSEYLLELESYALGNSPTLPILLRYGPLGQSDQLPPYTEAPEQ